MYSCVPVVVWPRGRHYRTESLRESVPEFLTNSVDFEVLKFCFVERVGIDYRISYKCQPVNLRRSGIPNYVGFDSRPSNSVFGRPRLGFYKKRMLGEVDWKDPSIPNSPLLYRYFTQVSPDADTRAG